MNSTFGRRLYSAARSRAMTGNAAKTARLVVEIRRLRPPASSQEIVVCLAQHRRQLRVAELGTEEREYVRIELLVEGDAVETRRISTDLGYGLRQSGRAGNQEGEMP